MGEKGAIIGGGAGAALGGVAGGPIGFGIGGLGGAAAGSALEDMFSGPDYYSAADPSGENFWYGGSQNYAQDEAAYFRNEAELSQKRAAPTTDWTQANADYAAQQQARGKMQHVANDYEAFLLGQRSSLADQQMRAGQQQAAQNAVNMAANARGSGADMLLAQRQAQQSQTLGAQATNRDAAMLRAQEEAQARNALASLYGQMRQGDMAARAGSQGQAQFGTEAAMRQQAMNDQYAAQMYGSGQAANRAGLQGTMGYEQTAAQVRTGTNATNAGLQAADRQRQGGLLSLGSGLLGGLL